MVERKSQKKTKIKPRIISITSGKGGVGKTLTTVNLAVAARRMNKKVLILDGDMGLANVDVVLGLQARYNIYDVLEGHAELEDIILDGPLGVKIIPAGSGITKLTNLSYVQRLQLLDQVDALEGEFDLILIDTGAGIAENVLHFNLTADETIIVTTPEPHAMTDAYAMLKVLVENQCKRKMKLLVNMTSSANEGHSIYKRIADVAERFLNTKIDFLGHVPFDPQIQQSVLERNAASDRSTYTIAGQAWNQMAHEVLGHKKKNNKSHNEMWRDLLWAERPKVVQSAI